MPRTALRVRITVLCAATFPATLVMGLTWNRAFPRPLGSRLLSDEKSSAGSNNPRIERLGDRYLMLVNTAWASVLDGPKLTQFDQSPYDGLAVIFSPPYDTAPAPSAKEMVGKFREWKRFTKKDLWPWVYLNRMIGVDDLQNDPHTRGDRYFHRIRGMDLDGDAGAQADFLQVWRNSLRAAKETKVPGVVCDLEFYNFYKEYDPQELARQTGKKTSEVLESLRKLGGRMASIAAQEYPEAVLWFLFTGFSHPGYRGAENQPYYLSSTYIVLGMLDEIRNKGLQLKMLSGGEVGLGYCHPSLAQFRNQIQDRAIRFDPTLEEYAGILQLGGTLTLWSELSAKKDWVNQGDCRACPAKTIEELQPYLELLLRSYRYNWIYGVSGSGYYAFEPASAQRFDEVIRAAQALVARSSAR